MFLLGDDSMPQIQLHVVYLSVLSEMLTVVFVQLYRCNHQGGGGGRTQDFKGRHTRGDWSQGPVAGTSPCDQVPSCEQANFRQKSRRRD